MVEAIEVRGLVKTFGRTRALDGLDLTVPTGQVHGFLGPNGAGKTTTLRILLGMLRADAGQARILGADPWHDATNIHRRLAYVPGDVSLWPNLTGGEVIDLLGQLRGGLDPGRRDALVDRFALDPTRKCRTYSKGNRQKVALVAALAADVELLLLDEPTSGLDPLMEEMFRQTVAAERDRGRTVLLSSHILAEAEALCDQVSIIRAGRTVDTGTLAELRHLTSTWVRAELAHPPAGLQALPGVRDLQVADTTVTCQVDTAALGGLLAALGVFGIRTLESRPPTLEELFLRHYRDDRPAPDPALAAAVEGHRAVAGPGTDGHTEPSGGRGGP